MEHLAPRGPTSAALCWTSWMKTAGDPSPICGSFLPTMDRRLPRMLILLLRFPSCCHGQVSKMSTSRLRKNTRVSINHILAIKVLAQMLTFNLTDGSEHNPTTEQPSTTAASTTENPKENKQSKQNITSCNNLMFVITFNAY